MSGFYLLSIAGFLVSLLRLYYKRHVYLKPDINLFKELHNHGEYCVSARGVINARALNGGRNLARYLSGDNPGKAQADKERHNQALEKYQADLARYRENRENSAT